MNKLLISLSAIAIAAASAYANAQTPSAGVSLQSNGTAAVAPAQGNAGVGLKADTGAKLDTESAKSQLNTKAEHGRWLRRGDCCKIAVRLNGLGGTASRAQGTENTNSECFH